jgi:hypothetical protein
MSELNQLSFKVISIGDLDQIHSYEVDKLKNIDMHPVEKELLQWSMPWRKESLEHYLKLGWSFSAHSGDKLVGYSLGQPFLFVTADAQTLWVEHVSGDSNEIIEKLVDVSIRWGRDKHFQKVIFKQKLMVPDPFKASIDSSIGSVIVKTTKSSN